MRPQTRKGARSTAEPTRPLIRGGLWLGAALSALALLLGSGAALLVIAGSRTYAAAALLAAAAILCWVLAQILRLLRSGL